MRTSIPFNNSYVGLFLAASVVIAGCSSEPTTKEVEVCSADGLENTVDAADWARSRAGIASYRYSADVHGGVARLDLRDAQDKTLGTLDIRQLFGDSEEPSGVMEGVLEAADGTTVRLLTRGEDVGLEGYTVRMRLESQDKPTVHIAARFETRPCWVDDGEPVTGPPCAARFPLDSAPFTLPSCGLIIDEHILAGRAPTLVGLTYAVAADGTSGQPSVGGFGREGAALVHHLSVLGSDGLAAEADVSTWLAETGADSLVGTQAERLITTAFLDRSWWRVLEHHVAHCELEQLPRPQAGDSTQTQASSLCPGDQSNRDWGSPNEGTRARVWGDPHLKTFDGLVYELQAAGEYVLFEAHTGDPLIMQARFEPLGDPPVPECATVTRNTGVATMVDGRRLTVRINPQWEVRLDGELIGSTDDLPELGDGASVTVSSREVNIRWPGGEAVDLQRFNVGTRAMLNIDASLPAHRRGQIHGLLGQFDGNTRNDLALPNGTVLEQPISFEDRYEVLAPAWRIRASDSLFDYADGEDTHTFQIPGFPEAPIRIDTLPAELYVAAEQSCLEEDISDAHMLSACILDVVCFGDASAASASAQAAGATASQPPGQDDVIVERAIRHVPTPSSVNAAAEAERAQCRPQVAPSIALFDERADVTLSDDVMVDITGPGTYNLGDLPTADSLSAGTAVTSYHLVRRPSPYPEHPYSGTARFARPILAVIIDQDTIQGTNDELGSEQTVYEAGDFQAFRSSSDVIEILADGRTLRVVWSGAGAHRVRVLTEPR